ncbi:MAG: T9SS type A sorting domain-containing protein [Salinivirgaceae bacterium]|nr:T9SS type A sorting domain-containing protein [Salinivirgaceae bacterium]
MKTNFLILLFAVILAGGAKAQSDTAYRLHHFLPDSAQFITCLDGVVYSIAGDTLINGKKMKKVYNPNQYYAAIYEDTLNAKYFVVYESDTEEKLFMDFSAKEGDEIMVSDKYSSHKILVDSIWLDDSNRKIVSIRNKCGHIADDWIEGIGSLWNVLIPFVTGYCLSDGNVESLARVVVDDSIVYEHFSMEDCKSFELYRYNSINSSKTNDNICVYPNPAKDFLIVDIESLDCLTYDIISVFGTIEQSGDLLPSINIGGLPQGSKLIVVKNDNGEIVYTNKFIKQ